MNGSSRLVAATKFTCKRVTMTTKVVSLNSDGYENRFNANCNWRKSAISNCRQAPTSSCTLWFLDGISFKQNYCPVILLSTLSSLV